MSVIVQVAREWIGTPYVHQAAARGAGCDCLGLLRGVWSDVSGRPKLRVPPYTPDWSEPQGDEVLWRGAKEYLLSKPIKDAAAGDVLLFRMRRGAVAKHLGIQGSAEQHQTFIHAYQGHGVVENTLSKPWRTRLVARFSFPEFS